MFFVVMDCVVIIFVKDKLVLGRLIFLWFLFNIDRVNK